MPTTNGKSDVLELLNETRPIRADMTLAEASDRLAALSKAKPEGSRVLEINPELAQHILDTCNVSNRPMKPGKVREYAEAMAQGLWGLTGDTIKFSPEGALRDGQNRLAATVRARRPLLTHVVFNVDADLFARMDIGKNRTPADIFHIAGYTYPNYAAATVRWLLILTGENPNNRGAHFTPEELLRAYRERFDPIDIEDSVKRALEVKKTQGAPVASTAALHYLMARLDKEKADAFLDDWASGQGNSNAPQRKLQSALVDISVRSNNRVHESVRNALILRAFNAYAIGRTLRKPELDFEPGEDEFPKLVGKPLNQVLQ
jgi:hypothetical protein